MFLGTPWLRKQKAEVQKVSSVLEYVWQTGKAYACNDASNERLSTLSSFFINAKINKNPMVTLFSWIIKWLLLLMKIDAMFYLFIYEQYWCYVIKDVA